MKLTYKGASVIIAIEHGGDACDSFARSGYNIATEKDLTDEELDEITEKFAGEIQEDWFEAQITKADFYYDH